MDYIVCEKPGQFALRQSAVPSRGNDEALLEIKRVGVCGTDLHAYAGNQPFFSYPRILGHEIAATILEVEDEQFKPGDHAIVIPYISCGTCIACRRGKTNCCVEMQVLGVHTDGGMQQQISVPKDLLMPANHLTFEEMAIVEPLAIGAHALSRAQIQPGDQVVVMGCGPIGLGIMKLAQRAGATVIALDVNDQRLAFAQEIFGIDHVVNVTIDPLAQVRKLTNNDLAPVVFDATGNQIALESGPQYMAHGGRYVLVGLSKETLTYQHPDIHTKETSILCSRNATKEDFQTVIQMLEHKQFPTDSFITHSVSYKDMIAHFDDWIEPESGVIKAMLQFE